MLSSSDVPRETAERLASYGDMLRKWNPRLNLVAPGSLAELETRHIEDSTQLLTVAPDRWGRWVDLGSGGGFPGLVISILRPDKDVRLIEADGRKAGFLRHVARELRLGAQIIESRIEAAPPQNADVVSARALAPLDRLLGYVEPHLSPSGTAILPKGRSAEAEIEAALEKWRFDCETIRSTTDLDGVILKIGDLRRVRPTH